MATSPWPAMPRPSEWRGTYRTLHMYAQVVGKIRMAAHPPMNQWWHVPLHVTTRGFGTTPIPHEGCTFELTFDLVAGHLLVHTSEGHEARIPLGGTVHAFYDEVLATLDRFGIAVPIWPVPVEVPDGVRFDLDDRPASWDPAQARAFFEVLRRVDMAFKGFRAQWEGKASPVHFFWGAFDLAVTRFSGRPAPERPGDRVSALAYNAELTSVGFWPGGAWPGAGWIDEAFFYAYTYPKPDGLEHARIRPAEAAWRADLGEFVLPYEAVRTAEDPAATLLAFARTTHDAGAALAGWPQARPTLRVTGLVDGVKAPRSKSP